MFRNNANPSLIRLSWILKPLRRRRWGNISGRRLCERRRHTSTEIAGSNNKVEPGHRRRLFSWSRCWSTISSISVHWLVSITLLIFISCFQEHFNYHLPAALHMFRYYQDRYLPLPAIFAFIFPAYSCISFLLGLVFPLSRFSGCFEFPKSLLTSWILLSTLNVTCNPLCRKSTAWLQWFLLFITPLLLVRPQL